MYNLLVLTMLYWHCISYDLKGNNCMGKVTFWNLSPPHRYMHAWRAIWSNCSHKSSTHAKKTSSGNALQEITIDAKSLNGCKSAEPCSSLLTLEASSSAELTTK